ncbi:hypothetical protein E2320_001249 [Naja naja]|nr:hypothetical protein E2320_001249 [Naja naja]
MLILAYRDQQLLLCCSRKAAPGLIPTLGRVHGELQPLFNVHLDFSITTSVQGFEGPEHSIQTDQAADEVVEIHAAIFIRITADHQGVELLMEVKPGGLESRGQIPHLDSPCRASILFEGALPLLDVVPEVPELVEVQLARGIAVHDGHHASASVQAEAFGLQVLMAGHHLVEDVHQLGGAHFHVITRQLGKEPSELA